MKKFILALVVTVMTVFATNANADEMDVQNILLDTVPGITAQEAAWCADAHRNGGEFIVKIHDITLKCSKNTLIKDWDLSKN